MTDNMDAPAVNGGTHQHQGMQDPITPALASSGVNGENLELRYAAVPEALRCLPQWVGYRLVDRDGRMTKVPVSTGGGFARVNAPATWSDFDAALQLVRNGQAEGLGFMLADEGDIVGIDLDHCVTPETGEIDPWARAIVERFDVYTEVSPSGTGLHLWMLGSIPRNAKLSKPHGIEVYGEARYLTVTGRCLRNPGQMREPGAVLASWYAETFPLPDTTLGLGPFNRSPAMDDEEIIRLASNAKNGDTFQRLWKGDISQHGDDPSAADAALVALLAFYTQDEDQLDRLFRRSGLNRPKWEQRADYRERTITFVLSGLRAAYGDRTIEKELTDLGNAYRMRKRYGPHLRFNQSTGRWLIWDDRRWADDERGQILGMAQETALGIYDELKDIPPDSSYLKQVYTHAKTSQQISRTRAMIDQLKGLPGISVLANDLDQDPWLLNCRNGTLDLRTGELRPHNPDDLITKITNAPYVPGAESLVWNTYLREAFPRNPELVPFLQRLAGYTLVGTVSEEIVVLMLGGTGSGKTTFVESFGKMLGDYGASASIDSFLTDKYRSGSSASPDMVALVGSRFVRSVEPDGEKRFDLSRLKALTGGDEQTARALYRDPFRYTPTYTLWVAANKSPELSAEDEAIWRRVVRLPFEQARLKREDRDPTIKDTLLDTEKSGAAILAWAVAGCLAWQRDGLDIPEIVTRKTLDLRQEMDPVSEFFEACCVFGPDQKVGSTTFYETYVGWHHRYRSGAPVSQMKLTAKAKEFGATAGRSRDGRFLEGVGLSSDSLFGTRPPWMTHQGLPVN
jgi:putative DNA primase/helicase